MSGAVTTSCATEIFQYSSEFAEKVIKEAFSDMKRDIVISLWSEDITNTAVHLARTYGSFTEKFYSSVLCDAIQKYSEHYMLVNHLIPYADRLAQSTVKDGILLHSHCEKICSQIFKRSNDDLKHLEEIRKVENWADKKAADLLNIGIMQCSKKESCEANESDCHKDKSKVSDPCQSYATSLVNELFSSLKVRDQTHLTITNSSQSDKSKSSHCGSCESISSDLLSPQSTADSSGLHHFADKLLYSLSALENRSTESISSTETTDSKYSIVDCLRRSSAPELRVSSRKSSLKTVFEEMPVECPETTLTEHHKHKYPSTSLGRRLRSSEERRCASMESIDDAPTRSSYSETLAKNILFSAYKDVM